MREGNPQPLDVRQKIANIGVFVLTQTAALQISPQFDHFKPLIEINRNIAAGLRPARAMNGAYIMADMMSILSAAYKINVLYRRAEQDQICRGRSEAL